jgi:CBS domain-containing membrane protein
MRSRVETVPSKTTEAVQRWSSGDRRHPSTSSSTSTRRLQVRDLMTEKVYALRPGDALVTARDLLDEKHIRHIPVVDDEWNVVGLLSHRDLVRTAMNDQTDAPLTLQLGVLYSRTVREIMTSDPETIEPDADIATAGQIMLDNKYGCLPVVEGQRLVGILTEADFVRYVAERS